MNKEFSVNIVTLRPEVLTWSLSHNQKYNLSLEQQLLKLLPTSCISNCSTYADYTC